MFRELFRNRKFVLGLILLLAGASFLFYRPAIQDDGLTPSISTSSSPASYFVPASYANDSKSGKDELREAINRKIDKVLSLIDDILD